MNPNSLENLKKVRKPVIWNGQRFDSIADCARSVEVSYGYMFAALNNGWKVRGHYIDEAL